MRKWNRVLVDVDPGYLEVLGPGRVVQGVKFALCDDDIEAIRQGYKCINCLENLESVFPKNCPVCEFPMKEEQTQRFGMIYRGHIPGARTGPDMDKIADQLEERAERRAFARKAKESGIVVPRMLDV